MYRIKTPKGDDNYWVPIIANPDIVEHYSENVVDTLHKKNLLLLGEDRYLSTLMLKTFPRRKMMCVTSFSSFAPSMQTQQRFSRFCPQAVCKTVVPDEFKVLLSQRRRWINSTVHNLFELLLVRDLCGTFCFSMQFVVVSTPSLRQKTRHADSCGVVHGLGRHHGSSCSHCLHFVYFSASLAMDR